MLDGFDRFSTVSSFFYMNRLFHCFHCFSMVHIGFSMALSNLTVVFIENSMVLIVHGFHRCSMVFGRCFHAFNRLLDGFHRFVCGFIQCFSMVFIGFFDGFHRRLDGLGFI